MNFKLLTASCFLLVLVNARAAELQEVSVSHDGNFIDLKVSDSEIHRCKLGGGDSNDLDATRKIARLSFDHSAVLIDNSEYLDVADIKKCGTRPLTPRRAAPNGGLLADINLSAGIYISLDAVGLSPLSFLATVSRIRQDRDLVNLPGAYRANRSLTYLQKYGFPFNESAPPIISRDGKYVSVGGPPDCSSNAFPGVWRIASGTRVILKNEGAEEIKKRCNELFQ